VSHEDLARNQMYVTERQRSELKNVATSIDEWLKSLGLVVRFERIGKGNVSRAAQLLNKTNQMNLRTRRLSEAELLAWADDPSHEAWAVHVADRFGDAGLTGIFALSRDGEKAKLEDWLLSCRVMGRRVEDTMLWAAACRAEKLGARALVIEPVVTKKNKPCIDFFAGAGLPREGETWLLPLGAPLPAPTLVSIEGLA
jgi:FkbH-like protein